MSHSEFNAIVRWLRMPTAYPHRPTHVDVVETHISVILIAGQFVYKLKRPVKYDFLDFTSLERRKLACHEEVRLNRRLAPDYYLGVVPITRESDGSFRLQGVGTVIDWLVHMRRLPIEQALDVLLRRGELGREHIDRLARVLSDFYRKLEPLPLTVDEYRNRYIAHVQGNLRELLAISHHCPENIVRRIHSFQLQLLHLRPEMFDNRVLNGHIIDGHGDLRPEHICFSKPLAIFDCIEFSPDFRRIDMADDIAFLASECDCLGAEWVGSQLFQSLESLSDDHPPEMLFDFYKSYRACVRAKVKALRSDQSTDKESENASVAVGNYLTRADGYVRKWARPLVLVVGGLSGTGKSTLATELASMLGCELLQTDAIRNALFGKSDKPVMFERGNYARESRQRVYAEMFRRAQALHEDGLSVILDGTFSTTASLRDAHQIISDSRLVFFAIECFCAPTIADERMASRLVDGTHSSEMRPELSDQQTKSWEPWPKDLSQCRINTEQPLDIQIAKAIASLVAVIKILTRKSAK